MFSQARKFSWIPHSSRQDRKCRCITFTSYLWEGKFYPVSHDGICKDWRLENSRINPSLTLCPLQTAATRWFMLQLRLDEVRGKLHVQEQVETWKGLKDVVSCRESFCVVIFGLTPDHGLILEMDNFRGNVTSFQGNWPIQGWCRAI